MSKNNKSNSTIILLDELGILLKHHNPSTFDLSRMITICKILFKFAQNNNKIVKLLTIVDKILQKKIIVTEQQKNQFEKAVDVTVLEAKAIENARQAAEAKQFQVSSNPIKITSKRSVFKNTIPNSIPNSNIVTQNTIVVKAAPKAEVVRNSSVPAVTENTNNAPINPNVNGVNNGRVNVVKNASIENIENAKKLIMNASTITNAQTLVKNALNKLQQQQKHKKNYKILDPLYKSYQYLDKAYKDRLKTEAKSRLDSDMCKEIYNIFFTLNSLVSSQNVSGKEQTIFELIEKYNKIDKKVIDLFIKDTNLIKSPQPELGTQIYELIQSATSKIKGYTPPKSQDSAQKLIGHIIAIKKQVDDLITKLS